MKKAPKTDSDKGYELWCWFHDKIPWDNSMGDYNYYVTEFIVKQNLTSEFKKFVKEKIEFEIAAIKENI